MKRKKRVTRRKLSVHLKDFQASWLDSQNHTNHTHLKSMFALRHFIMHARVLQVKLLSFRVRVPADPLLP